MNCTFRSIWNDTSGTFVAVAENASSAGKKTSSGATAVAAGARLGLKALAVSVMLSFGANSYALPAGGVVAVGDASISSTAGSTTITQSTQNASINWQSFGIGQGEAVHFVQPNSSSVTLNRVLGSDPSSILGSLSANGKVFLVNPNGILFGQGASVNVGGLVASTLNIADNDFMAGRYSFNGSSGAAVLNQGSINADGGYVALLGANVSNEGVISARLGTVALAAGNAVTLDVAGDGLLNVTVNQGAVNALVNNGGLIRADGGQVLLSAQSAGSLLPSAVNNTGVIQAQTLKNHNGSIRLLGGQSGTVSVGGTLDASGLGAGQSGGSVTATGQYVGLFGAQIKASGDAGGGTVLIGGGYQGQNPAVQNAAATYMSADSSISADAITNGSGGTVVLWADGSTRAYGSIAARGGAHGGDGGLIETSGHSLDVTGLQVNTGAAHGSYGTWLLDPADITISSAATTGATNTSNVFEPNSGVNAANINVSDLVTALGGSNVTVTTANSGASGTGFGDINVNDSITWLAATTLTLNAERDVNVNLGADITGTDGSLNVNAGRNINLDAAITTTTGGLRFDALNNVNLNAATTITTGDLTAIAGQNVNVGAAITVTTGNVILRADNDGTGPGDIVGGTVDITCGSNCITVGTGALSIRFNPVTYASTASEILAYDDNLAGGGTLDAKAWVFGLGDDKVYDGLRNATVSGLEPDTSNTPPPVALGAVTNALFDTKHVGTDKLITFDSTFSDAVYELFAPFGTPAGTYTTRADITPAALTINAVTDTRVYNGTTSSVGTPTATGLQAGDTLNGAFTQAYASKNVLGTNGNILVADGAYTVIDGNGGNNYTVTLNTAPGTITPLAITGTITAADKVYDGNNTATITSRALTGAIDGDEVSYSGGSATFSDKNVADGKTVTGSGLGLSGADAGNYTVNPTDTTTASITPPIETLPVETDEWLDVTKNLRSPSRPGVDPTWMPTVVLAKTPPGLLALAPAETPLAGPATAPVEAPPIVRQPGPVVVPVETPQQIYVAPVRPRKQDRN